MDETPHPRGAGLAALVARGLIDAELAALVALLVEARVPAVVAGPPGAPRDAVVDALCDALPDAARVVELGGEAEEFEWLPEATELGWRRERRDVSPAVQDASWRASSSSAVLLTRDLGGREAASTGGERARLVVRALTLGYGLVAGMTADGLEGVLSRLREPGIAADEDERSRLGLVLALSKTAAGARVTAAHYVRPVSRDQHGHVQRLPPAVLATWDPAADRWDHFAWGVLPELALRLGMRPIELEREQARRTAGLRADVASADR